MVSYSNLLLVLIATLIGAVGSLYLKFASTHIKMTIKGLLSNFNLYIGVFLYGLSTVLFLLALRGEQLSVVYPIVSTSYIWVSILSVRYLDEKMNTWKWFGVTSIIIGVIFIGVGGSL